MEREACAQYAGRGYRAVQVDTLRTLALGPTVRPVGLLEKSWSLYFCFGSCNPLKTLYAGAVGILRSSVSYTFIFIFIRAAQVDSASVELIIYFERSSNSENTSYREAIYSAKLLLPVLVSPTTRRLFRRPRTEEVVSIG